MVKLRRSDRRALLLVFVGILSAWGGILADRCMSRQTAPPASLDQVVADSMPSGKEACPAGKNGGRFPDADTAGHTYSPETFPFDPNTADMNTLLRLGLPRWQARNVLKYRDKGGRYHRAEDFKRLYGMTPELWDRLAPYIRIGRQFRYFEEEDFAAADARRDSLRALRAAADARRRDSLNGRYPCQPKFQTLTLVDLNTADSTILKQIPGIASYRARQILSYRERLGGYVGTEQLAEIEGFPAEELEEWFKVDSGRQRRLNVNTASVRELARHPYIGYVRAKAIESYRRNYGPLHSLDELRLLDEFPDDVRQHMTPYVTF